MPYTVPSSIYALNLLFLYCRDLNISANLKLIQNSLGYELGEGIIDRYFPCTFDDASVRYTSMPMRYTGLLQEVIQVCHVNIINWSEVKSKNLKKYLLILLSYFLP